MLALAPKDYQHPLWLHPSLVCSESQDPMSVFDDCYQEAALNKLIVDANTVNLATVSADGQPSNRMVTMKAYDGEGFVFFTNPTSHKGQDLTANPKVSLCFFWEALNRQIRVEGLVSFIGCAEADVYFARQPREQQVRAWVSEQSKSLDNLRQLKRDVTRLTKEFGTLRIPRPPSWSGYHVKPHSIEFMHREAFGLDKREIYHLAANHGWTHEFLSP
ncbi:pyridoxamine 5'-phosphate oxidase [Robiginitomaculum antarcticum]|uniref:pyridoxamine 5'-phosphate oxidase n=1 Tax=Robiginitomaculum antarcticum TaxID=437507 RepID=UPI000A008EDC|nr:pyridoxamine 5'-phosphate oxidase [Robiginitomaculum antarcticum]